MKKKFLSAPVLLLMAAMLALPVNAAAADLADPDAILPVDIVIDLEAKEIRKVYDLSPNTDPSTLPMDSFERDGVQYECTDILREVIIGSESQAMTQTETVESKNKDMETILGLLPEEKEVETEDGFTGTLHLVLDSIKTEVAGYGSSSKAVTATRSYPNLASADTSHLPKTITDGGRTLTLQNVQWQTDNTYNADDYEIGDRFTAICTYGGTKTTSYVTGYTTTADYSGEVYRTGVTVIRYTVIYTGTVIPPPAEPDSDTEAEPAEQASGTNWLLVLLPAAATLGLGIGGTYFLMKRKEQSNETTYSDDRTDLDAYHDGDDTSAGRKL